MAPSEGAAQLSAAAAATTGRADCWDSLGLDWVEGVGQGGAAVGSPSGAASAAGTRAEKVLPRLDVEPGVVVVAAARVALGVGKPLESPARGDRWWQGLPALSARVTVAVTVVVAPAAAGDGGAIDCPKAGVDAAGDCGSTGDGKVAGDSARNGGDG